MFRTDRSRHLIGLSDGDTVLLTSRSQGRPGVADRLNQDKDFAYVQSVGVPVRPCSCRTLVRLGGGRGVRPRQGAVQRPSRATSAAMNCSPNSPASARPPRRGAAGAVRFRRLLLPATELRQRARMVGARRPLRGWSARRSNWPCSIAMVTAGLGQDRGGTLVPEGRGAGGMPPPRMKWAFSTGEAKGSTRTG